MGLAPVPNKSTKVTEMPRNESFDWVKFAACGSLFAGGLLLLTGQKRAGLGMAASGTALTMLDQGEALRQWWNALPEYVDRAQWMVEQVREVVDDVTEKGEAMRRVLRRETTTTIPA
jgi:hypothetical protein